MIFQYYSIHFFPLKPHTLSCYLEPTLFLTTNLTSILRGFAAEFHEQIDTSESHESWCIELFSHGFRFLITIISITMLPHSHQTSVAPSLPPLQLAFNYLILPPPLLPLLQLLFNYLIILPPLPHHHNHYHYYHNRHLHHQ